MIFSQFVLSQDDKLQLNGINMEMKSLSKQPMSIVRFYTPDEDNENVKGKESRTEPRLKHLAIRGVQHFFMLKN